MSHDCFCIKHLLHQKRAIVLMSYLFLTTLLLCSEGNQKCSPDAGRLPCEETSLPTGKWQPIMLLTHWVGSRLYSRVPVSFRASYEPGMFSPFGPVLSSIAMLLMYGVMIWRWYKAGQAGRLGSSTGRCSWRFLVDCFHFLPQLSPAVKTEGLYVVEIGGIHCKEWSSQNFKAS